MSPIEDIEDEIAWLFAKSVSDPLQWYRCSRALFASARATRERSRELVDVFQASDLDRVTSMLYGQGLECLFKALITLESFGSPHDPSWDPVAQFPKELATHNLTKLANKAAPAILETHGNALDYFTDAVVWMGRYPSSKTGSEGGKAVIPWLFDEAEEIYAKYSRQFSISG